MCCCRRRNVNGCVWSVWGGWGCRRGSEQVWEECAHSKENNSEVILGVAVNVTVSKCVIGGTSEPGAVKQEKPAWKCVVRVCQNVYLTVFARPLYVTVVYQGKYSHCMRIGVAVPLNSTVYRLRDAVSRETKIPMDQVLFLSLYQLRVWHSEGYVTVTQSSPSVPKVRPPLSSSMS